MCSAEGATVEPIVKLVPIDFIDQSADEQKPCASDAATAVADVNDELTPTPRVSPGLTFK
jgi:hypothetical protein